MSFLLVQPGKLIFDYRLLSQFEYHEVTSDSNLFPMMFFRRANVGNTALANFKAREATRKETLQVLVKPRS